MGGAGGVLQRLTHASTACKCDNNQMIFKGIVSRYLGYLQDYVAQSHPEQAAAIGRFLASNVNSVLANNRAVASAIPSGYGLLWQGPVFALVPPNAGNTNQAVLDLLVAVLQTDYKNG